MVLSVVWKAWRVRSTLGRGSLSQAIGGARENGHRRPTDLDRCTPATDSSQAQRSARAGTEIAVNLDGAVEALPKQLIAQRVRLTGR